jgi:hypothetical protein
MVAWFTELIARGLIEICTGVLEPSPVISMICNFAPSLSRRAMSDLSVAPVLNREKAPERAADHLAQRQLDHSGEALVGIEDHLVRRQRQRPLVH